MNPIDVYKKLPCTNCGKCSARTCMAFSVQLLQNMISISECKDLDIKSQAEIEAMLSDTGDWKEKRLEALISELAETDLQTIASGTGAVRKDDYLTIKYMNRDITIVHNGLKEDLDIWDKLLILAYIKQAGKGRLTGKWVAFRDIKDGLLRSESFHGACEISLAKIFGKNRNRVLDKLKTMGAEKATGFSADHSYIVDLLPNIPYLILLWNDDDEFSADCKILLDSSATAFMCAEELLYLGMAFVKAVRQ